MMGNERDKKKSLCKNNIPIILRFRLCLILNSERNHEICIGFAMHYVFYFVGERICYHKYSSDY